MTVANPLTDWRDILARRQNERFKGRMRPHPRSGAGAKSALLDAVSVQSPMLSATDKCATFVISTPTPDRSQDVVRPDGCILDNYRNNPVCFFDHGMSGLQKPIGKCADRQGNLALNMSDAGIEATCYFADDYESDQIWSLVEQEILKAASINLTPLEATVRTNEDTDRGRPGLDITAWELLEWSIVSIPDNPEALRKVLSGGKLAGKPIIAAIRKSLLLGAGPSFSLSFSKNRLGKGFDFMTDATLRKDAGDDDTDTGMSMALGMSDDIVADGGAEDANGSDEDKPEPEGSKALKDAYSHVKSAHNVLMKHAARVEHPKVSKCMNKAAEEVGGTATDLAACHKNEYPDQDALETHEDNEPIESKSALRRLRYHTARTESLRVKTIVRLNALIKRCGDNRQLAETFGELRKLIGSELSVIGKGLEDVCEDAQHTVVEPQSDEIKKTLAELDELKKKFADGLEKLTQAIPRQ